MLREKTNKGTNNLKRLKSILWQNLHQQFYKISTAMLQQNMKYKIFVGHSVNECPVINSMFQQIITYTFGHVISQNVIKQYVGKSSLYL